MDLLSIVFIIIIIVGVVGAALYFLNRWAYKKMGDQQSMIERTKMTATIYVIDKKRDKAENVTLPKAVMDQLPKMYKFMKMYFVKAKIGPQIMTLMCEKRVFEALPVKKNVKVDIAGIYIVDMKGMKTKKEMQEMAQAKKDKAKADEKAAKEQEKAAKKAAKKKG